MSTPNLAGQAPSSDNLLYGFDLPDEETNQFLSSLIASGQAPQAELDELQQLSLMRGVEEWDMLFDCASALQERSEIGRQDNGIQEAERSLVPFLEAVLKGQPSVCGAGATSKDDDEKVGRGRGRGRRKASTTRSKSTGKGVSHFWGEAGEADETAGPRQRRHNAHTSSGVQGQGNSHDITTHATTSNRANKANGLLDCVAIPETRDIAPTLPPADAEVPAIINEPSSATIARHTQSPGLLSLPDRTAACALPEPQRDVERAVKATGGSRSPFFSSSTSTPTRDKNQTRAESTTTTPSSTKKKKPRPPRGTVSSLPIPPLSAARFGLIQEELAADPFRLLIAITFLIRTTGKAAIPVFRQLMERFPTPEALALADPAEIVRLIHPLGLSAVRCAAVQKYARRWLEMPPSRARRYGVRNYPRPGTDGRHVRVGEVFGPEDCGGGNSSSGSSSSSSGGGSTVSSTGDRPPPPPPPPVDAVADARSRAVGCAWEIGHLTQGPYALDSWRIFCRDVLLGRSDLWTGNGDVPEFQPEWMRVLPRDKELRACLRWMWMREGWEWDPLTGEREPLREEMRRAVDEGRVGYDDSGNLVILDQEAGDVGVGNMGLEGLATE